MPIRIYKNARVRIGINYSSLAAHSTSLLELTKKFDFWLYDFAPPGADWRLLESFPFSGIVLTESFFNDNYEKFTFPFFMATFREKRGRGNRTKSYAALNR
ncbi:Uncharacterised protein [Pantoea agglomerans]|uniref:Uncharacterized protein n=1 Tax=Enterobacter agglomerans TaxID=549 RepID=A0A379ALU3_ENTAG|nr:Uncharacterised protein [Pantoea agglomerans]